jgi:hypothetical protein
MKQPLISTNLPYYVTRISIYTMEESIHIKWNSCTTKNTQYCKLILNLSGRLPYFINNCNYDTLECEDSKYRYISRKCSKLGTYLAKQITPANYYNYIPELYTIDLHNYLPMSMKVIILSLSQSLWHSSDNFPIMMKIICCSGYGVFNEPECIQSDDLIPRNMPLLYKKCACDERE